MATVLNKFVDAYATMTVAVYQPLLLRWVSGYQLSVLASTMATRMQKAKQLKRESGAPTMALITEVLPNEAPSFEGKLPALSADKIRVPVDAEGNPLDPASVRPLTLEGFPNAVAVGNRVYPYGITFAAPESFLADLSMTDTNPPLRSQIGQPDLGAQTVPVVIAGTLGQLDDNFNFAESRGAILASLRLGAQTWAGGEGTSLTNEFRNFMGSIPDALLYEFWPEGSIEEALSPIGIAHYYRQFYFNSVEGVGPVENAFTVAPLETLEVVYQSARRQVHEEVLEQGIETVSETAVEEKNLDELSDKVSSMMQQDVTAAMSANVGGGVGVWYANVTGSANFAQSNQQSRELSTRRLKEMTKRAAERMTKSFSLRTRDLEEVTTTNLTRRVIRNELDRPVSYGLRRVLRRVRVKVQDMGARLVWQCYLRNPGEGLAGSRFVHFLESTPLAPPELPPGVPARPQGGADTGSAQVSAELDPVRNKWAVTLRINTGADRVITAARIDSVTNLGNNDKDHPPPVPRQEAITGNWVEATRTYVLRSEIAVNRDRDPNRPISLQVNYTYTWQPSQQALEAWERIRQAAVRQISDERILQQFEQRKTLITQRSKIRPRPANDLRKEERYEVMSRMISYLFDRGDDPSEPTPLEIEYFHRYFDIGGIFTYVHPSWWRPRYGAGTLGGFSRPPYEVTAESEPAPLGSSLGWLIQLDGDQRRNEFLNSPWVRVCVPIRSRQEREAIRWLARHVEGEIGYDLGSGALADLLREVERFRGREQSLGLESADYVTVDSSPGVPADPARPEGVYPIISEFDVTVPTDGFVYDELRINVTP